MAIWPFGGDKGFYEYIIKNIDLYGPWQIMNTWIIVMMFASFGNMKLQVKLLFKLLVISF